MIGRSMARARFIRVCILLPFLAPPPKVGLAIEGGGMRGCVSAGMIAAVSTLGLMDTFDAVYGSSAGSLVGAYAIAGQVLDCWVDSGVTDGSLGGWRWGGSAWLDIVSPCCYLCTMSQELNTRAVSEGRNTKQRFVKARHVLPLCATPFTRV